MSADPGGPEPTAHNLEHIELDDDGLAADGLPVGRRRFMKVFGAAAATAAAGSAATGTAAADDNDFEEGQQTYDPGGEVPTGSASVGQFQGPDLDVEEETSTPDADETILHSMAVSARESYQMHHNVFENHLMDMDTIASLEARDELARAWEDGDSPSNTYIERVLPRIRGYFVDPHEVNHLEAVNLAFAEFAEVHEVARADGDVNDDFLAFFVENDHPDETLEYASIGFDDDDEFATTELELHNGDTHTLEKTPVLHIYTESGDGETHTPLTTEILESWDDDDERYEIEADDGSHVWSTSLNVTVQNVGDPDDGGLESETVFWGRDLADLLEEIESQSDRVTGNYDEDLVEQFFDEMDDGNLDPSDVRGAEGNARFLAGTGDLSQDAFRMALLQQFNMEQPDLSEVASMAVKYTGYTSRSTTENEAGDRVVYPDDHTENREMEGFLFTNQIPRDGFVVGEEYATDPRTVLALENRVACVNPVTGSSHWVWHDVADPTAIAMSPDKQRVFVTSSSYDMVYALDAWTGDTEWSALSDSDASGGAIGVTADGETLIAANGSEAHVGLDPDTGEVLWQSDEEANMHEQLVIDDDREMSFHATRQEGFEAFDLTDDGTRVWGDLGTEGAVGAAFSEEHDLVIGAGDYGIKAYDPDTGDVEWENDSVTDGRTAAISDEHGYVYLARSDYITAFDIETGTEEWSTFSIDSDPPNSLAITPGEEHLVTLDWEGYYHVFDAVTGDTVIDQMEPDDYHFRGYGAASMSPYTRYDGETYGATMYDATEGEEVSLSSGSVTINEMTDSDGNEIEDYDPENWGAPEYNTNDSETFATYLEETQEYRIEEYWAEEDDEDDDSGWGLPSFGSVGTDSLLGLGIIGGVVMLVIGFVTDLLPWT